MKINEDKLRKIIRTETKMRLAESEIAQGLENVSGEARRRMEDQINDLALESNDAWRAFELVKKSAVQVAADYLGAPPRQVSSYFEEMEWNEEMEAHLDVVGSVTTLALLIAQGYLNNEK